jgi:hypothetical protein
MKDNKYYVPEIEEFCVGFEYERFVIVEGTLEKVLKMLNII